LLRYIDTRNYVEGSTPGLRANKQQKVVKPLKAIHGQGQPQGGDEDRRPALRWLALP
jgi:hypothetical protein